MKKRIQILFIGNSHTYYNDMPTMVARRAEDDGYDCRIAMIAHGGWHLSQHIREPEVRFNIRYGKYDYVVLQEYSHPFVPEEEYFESVRTLVPWIREAGSRPVLFLTWARKNEPEKQEEMTKAAEKMSEETGAILAPVGREWWRYRKSWPDLELYQSDGAHATRAGSDFAAKMIWYVIDDDLYKRENGI